MIDFFNRLDIFMKYRDLNDNKITVEAGISNGLIGKARQRGALSQDSISKILYTYPDLNANWLLTGKGEMLQNTDVLKNNIVGANVSGGVMSGNITQHNTPFEELSSEKKDYLEIIKKQQDQMGELIETNKILVEKII